VRADTPGMKLLVDARDHAFTYCTDILCSSGRSTLRPYKVNDDNRSEQSLVTGSTAGRNETMRSDACRA